MSIDTQVIAALDAQIVELRELVVDSLSLVRWDERRYRARAVDALIRIKGRPSNVR
jgi:hypothetical protein